MNKMKNQKISMHCILACLYFLALPFTIWTNTHGASLLKLMTIPIGGYFIISFMFYKKEFEINIVHILLMIYTITTLMTLYVDRRPEAMEDVFGYFLNAAIYVVLTVVSYNEEEIKLLENTQIALLVWLVGIVLYNQMTVFDRTTLAIFGQISDPNYFIGYFIFPLSVTMKKIVESKYRILYLILAIVAIYVTFLSGSRGGFLAIMITIGVFCVIYPKRVRVKVFALFAGIGALFFLWFILSPNLSDEILERMTVEAVIESRGTHRLDIWQSALWKIRNSNLELIFGRGISAEHTMIVGGIEQPVVIHNHFIQVLYSQGIIGFISFMILTAVALMRCVKRRKTVAVAIIGMMALAMSLSFNQTTRTFWNLIAYAALVFPKTEKREELIKDEKEMRVQ